MAASIVRPPRDEPPVSCGAPDAAQVNICLDRIRTSAGFVRSDRMVRFLAVILRYTVENRGSRLTERQIGCEVYDRPADWDPSVDTIVRSEARRLRAKLDQYYEHQGQSDPIRIHIPKGGYNAEFEFQSHAERSPAPAAADSPELAPQTSAPFSPVKRPLLWGLLLAVPAVAAIVGYLLVHRGRESESRFSIRAVSTEIGTEYSPALSPDGRQIAYVWNDGKSGPDIYLRGWNESQPHRLNPTSALRLYPSWSRDGKSLAYLLVDGEDVFVTVRELIGGEERKIAHMKRQVGRWSDDASPLLGPPGPCWTPDGELIVGDYDPSRAEASLVRLNMEGQRSILLKSEGMDHYLYPRLSPDGSTLAYVRYTSHGVGELFSIPLTGGAPKQLTSDSKTIQGLSWSPDGRRLLFSSNRGGSYQLWSITAFGSDLTSIPTNSTSATDPFYTAGGNILFVDSRENWNIWRRPVRGTAGSEQRFIASTGRNYDPRYSPDGRQIALASDRNGTMELWITDSTGANARQITHLAGSWLGGIAWSPDGKNIAFDARAGKHSAIYLIHLPDGTPRLLESNTFEERMPAWSQDSKTLYFNSNRDGELAIWNRDIATGKLRKIASEDMFEAAAGDRSLFMSTRTGSLWQSDLDGGQRQQILPDMKVEPVMSWRLHGTSLYLTRDDHAGHREILVRSTTGEVKSLGLVTGSLVPNAPDVDVSPDNSQLLFAEQDVFESDLKLRYTGNPTRP